MELEAKNLPDSEAIQQLEEVRLKKLKLRIKDIMAAHRGHPQSIAV